MTPRIQLGPFELRRPLARGGMGEVWTGVHLDQDVPVAIKLITRSNAREAAQRDRLRAEVRSMARLDHPCIALVLDQGDLPCGVDEASRGRLTAGSPYFVMELCEGGSLKRANVVRSWADARAILESVLDALAHAHARGVIHRDIKPGNVLVGGEAAGHPSVRLTDFGIAHALTVEADVDESASRVGTPPYMAPEQVTGDLRRQGPWTDLYAVGCLAYWLACGRPPYGGSAGDILVAQTLLPTPPLAPRFRVPRALQAWIERLMAKRVAARPRSAAAALWSLPPIATGPWLEPVAPEVREERTAQTATHETHAARPDGEPVRIDGAMRRAHPSTVPPPVTGSPIDALPSWRSTSHPARNVRLRGAGLRLYGLRPIPLAGRERERDALWAALQEVGRNGRAAAVLLQGPAGVGKSRLTEWLAERVRELGVGHVLAVRHTEGVPHLDPLARMLAEDLRCVGLTGEALRTRIREALDDLGVAGLTDDDAWELAELLEPSGDPAGVSPPGIRSEHKGERHAVVRRHLARFAKHGPVVLVVDDAQWGAEALELARYLLRLPGASSLPVLIVATVREEELASRPMEATLIEDLLTAHQSRALHIGMLSKRDHADLVERLLGLDGDAAKQVRERTGGNALFAVQLVGDWVQRGALVVGEDGFRLRPDADADLPDDIHSLWSRRIDVLSAIVGGDDPDSVRATLEVAAALGGDVDEHQWTEACREAGLRVPSGMVDAMATARLATTSSRGWSLVHGMLRESLERQAREADRWAAHNLACARVLQRASGGPHHERVGRHMFEAARYDQALEPLLAAARHRLELGDFDVTLRLIDLRERALGELERPTPDPEIARGGVWRAASLAQLGRVRAATTELDAVEPVLRRRGEDEAIAHVAWIRGGLGLKRGDPAGRAFFEEAMRRYQAVGDRLRVADCLYGIGEYARWHGELELAVRHQLDALEVYEQLGRRDRVALTLWSIAETRARLDQLDDAAALIRRGLQREPAARHRWPRAVALNVLGDVERSRGNHREAEDCYRQVLRLTEELGSQDTFVPRMNLALTSLALARYEDAREVLEAVRGDVEASRPGYLGFLHAGLLPCAAARGDWVAFDESLEATRRHVVDSEVVDPDLAFCMRTGGELALEHGERARAESALRMAADQLRRLGRTAAADAVAAMLR